MNKNDENEIKKEFQLERVILFSDAVFAIIITIIVLDTNCRRGPAMPITNINLLSNAYGRGNYIFATIILLSIFSQTLLTRYLVVNSHKLCFDPDNLHWLP
jgi:cation transporter-like permease